MWFKKLTGFAEKSPSQVRENLFIEDNRLVSNVSGQSFAYGSLSTPNLKELREQVQSLNMENGKLSLQEIVADTQDLHCDIDNAGSLFQVASQFNLLEMVSPEISPESGIDGYEYDHTQGPACAIAAGAGTIYRNYFAHVKGGVGQSADNQIDTLVDLGESLGNASNDLWVMKNGYALASKSGLEKISEILLGKNDLEIDEFRKLLRIGLQNNTEVTIGDSKHTVSQAYCSALPVAYSQHSAELWQPFASLVLEASYEATICAAIINIANNSANNPVNSLGDKKNKVFLTMLGGGAFGNEPSWIINAIERAVTRYKHYMLEVFIVSYGASNSNVKALINRFNE